MLALEVCHSSQSVVFNSLIGIPLKFKCWTAVDGVEKWSVCVCFCLSVCVIGAEQCEYVCLDMCWWGVSMGGSNVRRWLSLMEHQLTLEKYSCR